MRSETAENKIKKPEVMDVLLENNRLLKENNMILKEVDEKLRKIAINTSG